MSLSKIAIISAVGLGSALCISRATETVFLTEMPDYTWYAGCFGSASGNMMGFWDRHGFPNFYTGPTAGGVAPLNSNTSQGNEGIRSMWASKAGFDGRPAGQLGHMDDYWETYVVSQFGDPLSMSYESTAPDPYVTAGRTEHRPDCVGDFMGASQNKWSDLNGESSGNIDAFSFNFWDKSGARRLNFTPPDLDGKPVRDIQSGWRKWAEYRGYQADVVSQMVDFSPEIPTGTGFTFEDLRAEIDAGYPVMLFLQQAGEFSRALPGNPRANAEVHGMVAYGYTVTDSGTRYVRYRTSWGSGDTVFSAWAPGPWQAGLDLRGVIMFHPKPQITSISKVSDAVSIKWDGPTSNVRDSSGATLPAHFYVIEKSETMAPGSFVPVSDMTSSRETMISNASGTTAFYRIKLLNRTEVALSGQQ